MDLSAFQKLDRVIHEKGRFAIMAALAPVESLTFKEMKDLLGMTDGNLSVHMRTLEENRYVHVDKVFVERKPRTTYSLTSEGRRAFAEYIETLESIIQHSRAVAPQPRRKAPAGGPLPSPTAAE